MKVQSIAPNFSVNTLSAVKRTPSMKGSEEEQQTASNYKKWAAAGAAVTAAAIALYFLLRKGKGTEAAAETEKAAETVKETVKLTAEEIRLKNMVKTINANPEKYGNVENVQKKAEEMINTSRKKAEEAYIAALRKDTPGITEDKIKEEVSKFFKKADETLVYNTERYDALTGAGFSGEEIKKISSLSSANTNKLDEAYEGIKSGKSKDEIMKAASGETPPTKGTGAENNSQGDGTGSKTTPPQETKPQNQGTGTETEPPKGTRAENNSQGDGTGSRTTPQETKPQNQGTGTETEPPKGTKAKNKSQKSK